MLEDNGASHPERPQPRQAVRRVAKTLPERQSGLDPVGYFRIDALRAGVPDSPEETCGNQRLVGIVSIDLPFDADVGDVKPGAFGHAPVARDPAVVDDDADRRREKTRKGPIDTVVRDVTSAVRM